MLGCILAQLSHFTGWNSHCPISHPLILQNNGQHVPCLDRCGPGNIQGASLYMGKASSNTDPGLRPLISWLAVPPQGHTGVWTCAQGTPNGGNQAGASEALGVSAQDNYRKQAALGCPGFSHLKASRRQPQNSSISSYHLSQHKFGAWRDMDICLSGLCATIKRLFTPLQNQSQKQWPNFSQIHLAWKGTDANS